MSCDSCRFQVLQERLREIHEQEVIAGVQGVQGDRSRLESCIGADETTDWTFILSEDMSRLCDENHWSSLLEHHDIIHFITINEVFEVY